MQSGILRDPGKLEKTRFREASWQQELGGLKYIGQTRLGGSFVIHVFQLYSLVDQLPLGGRRRGFSPSSSISSSITHLSVILSLHLSSLLLSFNFISLIMDEYGLGQCYRLFALIYSYSIVSLSQSKSNLAVILIWGSKQVLVFSHKFELSNTKQTIQPKIATFD